MSRQLLSRERLLRWDTALSLLQQAVLIFGSVIMVLPFIWMLSTSLKPPTEVVSWPPRFVPLHPTLENYQTEIGRAHV